MVSSDLLSVTLALTLVSFIATLYVIVRTLTPLVGPHILSRYSRSTNPLPVFGYASNSEGNIKLRSAQRFQCWLAFVDLASCAVWLWEVIALAAGSASSPARMAFVICARPTILVVVSLLSYLNVVRGKVIDLGRLDFIVWIPSIVLLAIMVSLAYVAPTTSPMVWQAMMAVETILLSICTFCFGRLLLAVFRVRRATLQTNMLRTRIMQEEKAAEQERMNHEEEDRQAAAREIPPILPPLEKNRWLISKTFLLAKASSAANTVSTSLHRRSQSGAATLAGRVSTSDMPRVSITLSTDQHGDGDSSTQNGPYSFLRHDPTTTTRYGHFRANSNSEAESQSHAAAIASPAPASPVRRAVSFDIDTAARGARSPSPLMMSRSGAVSRLTDWSRISTDDPRPSMGSYISSSGDSHSSESGGVAGYLSGNRLGHHGNASRNSGLSKREARKAGARMGGHLFACVASWTFVLPFLVYKMHQPSSPAPFYASVLVAFGLSLSGPILAVQTVVAEGGFWYKKVVAPLMASSSAVAFEPLNSRANTPGPALQPPLSATLTQPNSANTDITQATAQSAASTHVSSHRSSSSSGSTASLASIAAFSHPAPGTFRHSLDTQDAPTSMIARAFAMAAPHPKLQIIKSQQVRDSTHIESIDVENGDLDDEVQVRKREARKLKTYSMSRTSLTSQRSRRRSNTVAASEISWDELDKAEAGRRTPNNRRSALSLKDANILTAAMLAERKRSPSPSPSVSSFTFRSSTGTAAHERRRSAPITPTSRRTVDESGVVVPHPGQSDYNIDSLTASLLTNMLPGMRISASSISSNKRHSVNRKSVGQGNKSLSPQGSISSTSSKKKRPGLNLDLAAKNSSFSKCDQFAKANETVISASLEQSTAIASSNDAGSRQNVRAHLRRRSTKSVSYSVENQTNEQPVLSVNTANVTTRRAVKPRLSPAVESRESEDDPRMPEGPRPWLEMEKQAKTSAAPVPRDEERVEILSERTSKQGLLSSTLLHDAHSSTTLPLQERPSIIIRTKASVASTNEGLKDDSEELGTVAMATRVIRTPSRSSFASDVLRPVSMSSSDENTTANRSRASTFGSITSEGFRNMIQSNRNSWTGSDVGNESITALLDRHGALADAVTSPACQAPIQSPLQQRDRNISMDKLDGDQDKEKLATLAPPASPGAELFRPRAGSLVSPQRVNLADIRSSTRNVVYNDENVPPSPTQDHRPVSRQENVGRYQARNPRLAGQRSILSLR